jgi:hypothetical protein
MVPILVVRKERVFQKLCTKPVALYSEARIVGRRAGTRLNRDAVLVTLGGIEHAEGSSQTKLHARKGRVGAWGEDTDALVSLQRQALAGLPVEGAAGWDALFALSLTKARFAGRDSIKLDREQEVMIAVL